MTVKEKIFYIPTQRDCFKCGGRCCYRAYFTTKEIDFLKNKYGIPEGSKIIETGYQVFYDGLGYAIAKVDGICGYLKNGKCLVYQDRPQVCRDYGTTLDGRACMFLNHELGYFSIGELVAQGYVIADKKLEQKGRYKQSDEFSISELKILNVNFFKRLFKNMTGIICPISDDEIYKEYEIWKSQVRTRPSSITDLVHQIVNKYICPSCSGYIDVTCDCNKYFKEAIDHYKSTTGKDYPLSLEWARTIFNTYYNYKDKSFLWKDYIVNKLIDDVKAFG